MTEHAERPRLSIGHLRHPLPYDRAGVTPGIVHLGIGAFHRAHMAAYVEDVLRDDPSWGIVGVSLRRPDTRRALAPQDFLYTLAVRSPVGTTTRVIGSILEVLDATTQRDAVIAALIDPRIRIVSLTVTEKGYCHDPATGMLDMRHPDIIHDVAHPDAPVSTPGFLVRALQLRRVAGLAPFTVMSCDNLPANGTTTAGVVTTFAACLDSDLARYISAEVAFPSTMVDRIVPATNDRDREELFKVTGLWDRWPVVTEPFTQWVIEDRFPYGRPPLDRSGAQFVGDVQPFELMKLRMLNGSHSSLAYLGYLAGYEYVNQAITDPRLGAFVHALMTMEVMSTLPTDVGHLPDYRDALLARFANPALKHRTWQIAMDGSQKLPQRLLGTIRDRLAKGLPVARAALGVAAWMRYVAGVDEQGREIDVRDPLASRLRAIAERASGEPKRLADGLLNIPEIFGQDLPRNDDFRALLEIHLSSLFEEGALATVSRLQ